ncbi:MAG: thioredoxin-like domain-containing protein [Bacteroidota bacterium]
MHYRLIVVLLFFLQLNALQAKPFRVFGKLEGHHGEQLRILTPADPFSGMENTLVRGQIDSNGYFSLQADIKNTLFAWISLGFSRSEIYLYPGLELEIDIKISENPKAGRNPFLEPPSQNLELISEKPRSLNRDITSFNSTFDDFLILNTKGLQNRRNTFLLDSLNKLITSKGFDTTDTYLKDYIFYKLADISVFLREMKYPKAYGIYLSHKPLNFDNIAFSDFFNNFFADYLLSQTKSNFLNDLDLCINKNVDLYGLLDSLGKDSLLRNEKTRELVLLKHLPLFYNQNNFSKPNIIHLLETFAAKGKFKDHRQIALNLLSQLSRFEPGTPLPAFTFLRKDGIIFNNDSLKGKINCLLFFTTVCDACLAEHDLIRNLQKKYSGRIRFISVCCDIRNYALSSYLRDHPKYNWLFVEFNGDFSFLETMEIKSSPLLLITDREGRLIKYPAKLPSEGLEKDLEKL